MYYKLLMWVTTFKFKIQKIISLFDKYYRVLGIREYNLRLKNAAEERHFSYITLGKRSLKLKRFVNIIKGFLAINAKPNQPKKIYSSEKWIFLKLIISFHDVKNLIYSRIFHRTFCWYLGNTQETANVKMTIFAEIFKISLICSFYSANICDSKNALFTSLRLIVVKIKVI